MRDAVLGDLKCAGQLTGLSAAFVYLVSREGRHWFVRKAVKKPEGNLRLQTQAAKQRVFTDLDGITVPRILDEGEVDGRYFFDMEYVQGPDGVSFLRRASYPEITRFTERLAAYLQTVAATKPLAGESPGTLFTSMYKKLCDVQAQTQAIPDDALARLFMAMERLFGHEDLPQTLCHGDLTLENMIVREDGSVVMLDLLAAPFEHYWQDIAKLHQDLAGGWFMRSGGRVSQCVLDYVGRSLMSAGLALNHDYAAVHPLLMAVVFVRILPYVRDAEERSFVLQRIEHFAERALT